MQLTTKVKDLRAALDRVASIPGSPSPSAMLVRLEIDMAELIITRRTDATTVTIECPAAASKAGSVDVGFEILSRVVHQLPGEEATLTLADPNLLVTSGKMRNSIALAADEQFLDDPGDELVDCELAMPIEDFIRFLKAVSPAASNDTARPALCGVMVGGPEDFLITAASGTLVFVVDPVVSETMPTKLIPNAAVAAINRIFAGAEGKGSIAFGESSMTITTAETTFRTALSAERCINYLQVIQKPMNVLATVEREPFLKAIKAGAPLCTGPKNPIELHFEDGLVKMLGFSGLNEFESEMEAVADKDDHIIISCPELQSGLEFCTDKFVQLLRDDSTIGIKDGDRTMMVCLCRIESKRKKKELAKK